MFKNRHYYDRNRIIRAIHDFLIKKDFKFVYLEKDSVFHFNVRIRGSLKELDFMIQVWDKDGYGVFAVAPLGVDDRERMLCLLEFFARVNNVVRWGSFLLDMDSGGICYKYYVDCSGGVVPTDEMIEMSFLTPGRVFELYSMGITEIIFGKISAQDAFEKCRRRIEGDVGKR